MTMDAQFWIGLLQIIAIDIILSGDNAVIIALACRSLPKRQQKLGVMLGAGAAVGLRVIFTIFVAYLLGVPYLKIIGGVLLLWIGYKLMQPQEEHDSEVEAASNLWGAVRTILIADAVMSLDNVIAIAAAAKGDVVLLILGLLISIPLVVFGATLMLRLIDRYPVIVTAGAALIGYIGGEVIVTDPVWADWINTHMRWVHYAAPILGGVLVVLIGSAVQTARSAEAATGSGALAATAGIVGARAALLILGQILITRAPLIIGFFAGLLGLGGGYLAFDQGAMGAWATLHAPILHTVGPLISAAIAIVIVAIVARFRRRPAEAGPPPNRQ